MGYNHSIFLLHMLSKRGLSLLSTYERKIETFP